MITNHDGFKRFFIYIAMYNCMPIRITYINIPSKKNIIADGNLLSTRNKTICITMKIIAKCEYTGIYSNCGTSSNICTTIKNYFAFFTNDDIGMSMGLDALASPTSNVNSPFADFYRPLTHSI